MHPDALSRRVVTTAELQERGATPTQIGRLLAHGCLVRISRGVYACVRPCARLSHSRILTGVPIVRLNSPEQHLSARAVAIARRLGPEIALTGAAVAAMHGLPVIEASDHPVDLRTDRSRTRNRSGYRLVPGFPDLSHVTAGTSFGIASLPLALADMSSLSAEHVALAALDAALARGMVLDSLGAHLAAFSSARRRRAEELMNLADPRAESPGESWARWLFHVHGLPRPELQVKIFDSRGRFIARVDALWRDAQIVFEFDGHVKYRGEGAADAVFQEKVREDRLRAEGYTVVRAIWADFYRFRRVVERLESGLERGFTAVNR